MVGVTDDVIKRHWLSAAVVVLINRNDRLIAIIRWAIVLIDCVCSNCVLLNGMEN